MQHVEALREVKRAEDEVKRLKEDAARKAADAIRAAERRATELIEQAKADADAEHSAGIKTAHDAAMKDRQKIVHQGETEAKALVQKATGGDLGKAVDLVLNAFDQRVNRK